MGAVRFSIKCPSCGRVGSTTQQIPVGARVKCPGCQQSYRYQGEEAGDPTPSPPQFADTQTHATSITVTPAAPVFAARAEVIPGVSAVNQYVQVNVPEPSKGNALAVASLVLGILAVLVCWVPFVGLLAIPIGLLGLVLGVVALTLVLAVKRRGLAAGAVGTGLSVLAMVLSVAITGMTSRGLSATLKELAHPGPVAPIAHGPEAPVPPPANVAPVVPDDITVNVTKAEFRNAYSHKGGVFGSGAYQVNSPCFITYFEMKNNTANRKYDSGGWPTGQLSDEFGNQYRLISDDHAARPDVIPLMLRPGETLRDVLVFEPPLSQAKRLTFELQHHFSSPIGPPRDSVAIEIPVAKIVNLENTPPAGRDQ